MFGRTGVSLSLVVEAGMCAHYMSEVVAGILSAK